MMNFEEYHKLAKIGLEMARISNNILELTISLHFDKEISENEYNSKLRNLTYQMYKKAKLMEDYINLMRQNRKSDYTKEIPAS